MTAIETRGLTERYGAGDDAVVAVDGLDLSVEAGEVPFYLKDWFAVVVLVACGLLPVVLGYRRFRGPDLG